MAETGIIIGGDYTPGGSCFAERGLLLLCRNRAPLKETIAEACRIARDNVCRVCFGFGPPGHKVYLELGPTSDPEDVLAKYVKSKRSSQKRNVY